MQGPISLKRDDDDDNGMQGPISLKRDAASFSASVQHCTLRPLAGCTDLTGHRSFAIIIVQRQGKLPTADAFLQISCNKYIVVEVTMNMAKYTSSWHSAAGAAEECQYLNQL